MFGSLPCACAPCVSAPPGVLAKLASVDFNVWEHSHDTLTVLVFAVLQDLGCVSRWRLPVPALQNFILSVRSRYRENAYHNWQHAFTVFQVRLGSSGPVSFSFLSLVLSLSRRAYAAVLLSSPAQWSCCVQFGRTDLTCPFLCFSLCLSLSVRLPGPPHHQGQAAAPRRGGVGAHAGCAVSRHQPPGQRQQVSVLPRARELLPLSKLRLVLLVLP